jgi:hypothetical protein
MEPGITQIEGSASDWLGIQNFVSLRSSGAQIVFVSPEIPLVQLGGINLGEFSRVADPGTSHLYSWVMNNYWTTNFLASEEGELKWSYQLTTSDDTSNLFATRFGWENRIPFLTRIFPGGKPDSIVIPLSFIGSTFRDLVMVNIRPSGDGKGIILHLRETDGKTIRFPLRDLLSSSVDLMSATRAVRAFEVNVLEEDLRILADSGSKYRSGIWLEMKPYETKFIKLVFD